MWRFFFFSNKILNESLNCKPTSFSFSSESKTLLGDATLWFMILLTNKWISIHDQCLFIANLISETMELLFQFCIELCRQLNFCRYIYNIVQSTSILNFSVFFLFAFLISVMLPLQRHIINGGIGNCCSQSILNSVYSVNVQNIRILEINWSLKK